MQRNSEQTAIETIARQGTIFNALASNPDIAGKMVELIAQVLLVEGLQVEMIEDIESQIRQINELVPEAAGLTTAHFEQLEGFFESLFNVWPYIGDTQRADGEDLLTEQGVDCELAEKFYSDVSSHCISFLRSAQGSGEGKYDPGEIAQKISEEIDEEVIEEADDDDEPIELFFDPEAIATKTGERLMEVFNDLLIKEGAKLVYQVLHQQTTEMLEDLVN